MGDVQGRNNVVNKAQKYTVVDFNAEFPNDDACLDLNHSASRPAATMSDIERTGCVKNLLDRDFDFLTLASLYLY